MTLTLKNAQSSVWKDNANDTFQFPEWRTAELQWFPVQWVTCSPHKHTYTAWCGHAENFAWSNKCIQSNNQKQTCCSSEQYYNKSSACNVTNICAAASGCIWSRIASWCWQLPRIVPALSSQMTSPNLTDYLTEWFHLRWCHLSPSRKKKTVQKELITDWLLHRQTYTLLTLLVVHD